VAGDMEMKKQSKADYTEMIRERYSQMKVRRAQSMF
jgi:hypothetical protein